VLANSRGYDRIYRNDAGTMVSAWSAPNSSMHVGVTWGDYNGDGYLDLAFQDYTGSTHIFRNTQDGNFTLVQNIWNAGRMAWGDYNRDGLPDLAIGNGDTIYLYRSNGNSLVAGPTLTTGSAGGIFSLAWGDYDNNGWLDLAVGKMDGYNQVFANSSGSLSLAWTAPLIQKTVQAIWGDYDNDGDLDLAAGNTDEKSRVYRNNAGSLTLAWENVENHHTSGVYWIDWDMDGDLDLELCGYEGIPGRIYRNEGGTLTYAWEEVPSNYMDGWGDWDGDGDPDLMVAWWGGASIYRNNNTGSFQQAWVSPTTRETRSVAWGDYDNDGYLDLAVGNYYGQSNQLYHNVNGVLTLVASWNPAGQNTRSLAWGDVDGDGDLDLAVGNYNQSNQLYRNTGGVLALDNSLWSAVPASRTTTSLAWADIDGDGDLDLAVGNSGQSNQLYRNLGGVLTPDTTWNPPGQSTSSLAWADIDGDGDPDLAVGNNYGYNQVYRNDNGSLALAWTAPQYQSTVAVAWADWDLDGDPDLAVGNFDQTARVYRNDGGSLALGWNAPLPLWTSSTVWGDYNNDGYPDLAVGANGAVQSQLYRNAGGDLLYAWDIPARECTWALGWGDVNRDGDLDLLSGRGCEYYGGYCDPSLLHSNNAADGLSRQGLTTAYLGYPLGAGAAAPYFSSGIVLQGPTITIPYILYDPQGDPARQVKASYSLDGGATWAEAVPAAGTPITNLAASPGGTAHTFTWDVYASGFYGASDTVVVRLEVYQSLSVRGPFMYSLTSARTLPFRARGTQVRVVDEAGSPVAGAIVYTRPAGQSGDFAPFQDHAGHNLTTNPAGYLLGYGQIKPNDQLVALLPVESDSTHTLYWSSAAPTPDGIDPDLATLGGVQTLIVRDENPLLLFHVTVSLEWDARLDAQYLARLKADLQRTSELLFDWSNGQVALGQVTVYHARQHWNDADIRIYASNRLRPNASQGGITASPLVDPDAPITYYPGQVYMGITWNRYGSPGGALGDDWPRTLAHELGHYALYLDDNYLGLDAADRLISLDPALCPSAMSDPYRQDLPFDELHANEGWSPACDATLSNLATGRSDWHTITTFYDELAAHAPITDTNAGPADLPLAVTAISFVAPASPPTALADPTFYLTLNNASYRPGERARAFLFSGGWITDLGRPVQDTVVAHGASPGDTLCVFEMEQSILGCKTVSALDQELKLQALANWQPQVLVTPVNATSTQVTVSNLPSGLTLRARLYPMGAAAGSDVPLSWNGSAYEGSLLTANWVSGGYVHIWVVEPAPKREAVVDFSLGGSPGREHIGSGTLLRGRFAPAVSSDGQVILFGDIQLSGDQFYALQAAAAIPQPPSYATVVGQAYYLLASADAPNLSGASISISYMASEVSDGEEIWLRIYYWDGTRWLIQPTTLDTTQNMASAACLGDGLYTLMSSVEVKLTQGWNLISYPIPVSRPVTETLVSISGTYAIVYNFNQGNPTDPWQLYAQDAPGWVNDLNDFEFSQGYWISATMTTTLYLKGGFGAITQEGAPQGGVPYPPASYYGVVQPSSYFTPLTDMPVQAYVGKVLCGQGVTLEVGGQIVYTVSVNASVQTAGCGVPGSPVSISIAGQPLFPHLTWNNYRLWQQDLTPNIGPDLAGDDVSMPEDTSLSIPVLLNDSDLDSDPLSLTGLSLPAHGAAVISGTQVLYTPLPNYFGLDQFLYTVTDGYFTSQAAVTITVVNVNDAPLLSVGADWAVPEHSLLAFSASATDFDPVDTLTFSLDSGAPVGASIDPLTGVFAWTPTEDQGPGVYTLTVRLTDSGSPALEDWQIIHISVAEANAAPALDPISAQTVGETSLLTFTIAATDSDTPANTLTFSLDSGAPVGASIDPLTGLFTWTPTEAQGPGVYNVTVRVADNGLPGLDDSETIQITVNEVNLAPVLSPIADAAADELVLLSFTVSATDDDLPANSLIYSLDPGAPAGASIDPVTGVFAWTPTEDQGPGVYTLTVRLTDNGSSPLDDWQAFRISVAEVNTAPGIAPLPDQVINEMTVLTFTAVATDSDTPANTIIFSLHPSAPSGASIDPVTGVFHWTPSEDQGPGVYVIIVQATDNGTPALQGDEIVVITVNEVNRPPVVDAGPDQSIDEAAVVFFSGSYNDPGLAHLPQAASITWDMGDGSVITGTMKPVHTYANDGVYTVTLTVSDGLGGTGQDTLLVTVNNVAPLVSLPPNQNAPLGQPVGIAASFTDPGWLDAHSVTIAWGDGLTDTLDLPAGILDVYAVHTFTNPGTYTVSVTVSDDNDATTGTFLITVKPILRWYLPWMANSTVM